MAWGQGSGKCVRAAFCHDGQSVASQYAALPDHHVGRAWDKTVCADRRPLADQDAEGFDRGVRSWRFVL